MGSDLSVAWNIAIEDADGVSVIQADAPFEWARFTWSVENQGGGSCEIGLADAMVTSDWSQPKRIIVTGERPWSGDLTRIQRGGPPSQVGRTGKAGWVASGLGLYHRLDYRIVRHIYEIEDTLDMIVQSLLDEIQTQFHGNMGFTVGSVFGGMPTRRKAYCFGVNVGDAIRELMSIHESDWEVTEGQINMWNGSRGVDSGLTLTQNDCQVFDVSFDTSTMLTTVSALGDPSDPFGPKHNMAKTRLADDYGRRETTIETDVITNNEKNPNWKDDLAKAAHSLLRTEGGGQLQLRTVWSSKNAPWRLTDVWLQDTITVDLTGTPGAAVIPSPILNARLTDVTVTLETMPPGTPATKYWVECNWDALVLEVDVTDGDPDFEAQTPELAAATAPTAVQTAQPSSVDPAGFPYWDTPPTTPEVF